MPIKAQPQLNVLGIEAYAHLSEVEQQEIIECIWTRRAYANLIIADKYGSGTEQ